ncbi:polysaccharide deacetylase family protein [Candidatus Sumerlaeota bacterium]|nr:polysaccharide deacetylase family protein [Candidatus Sumerlaeota bacterium]
MPILTFHHIGHYTEGANPHERGNWIEPDLFRQQLLWLKAHNYQCIKPADLLAPLTTGQMKTLPQHWALLTFDDGWKDNATQALPILRELKMPATLFLAVGRVGTEQMMSSSDVEQWIDSGCNIESHTCTHPHLDELPHEKVMEELTRSRDELKRLFGVESKWICYPYGHFNQAIVDAVQTAGYDGAFSTMRDNRFLPRQRYYLPRVQVMNDTQPQRLAYMDSLLYHWLHRRKNIRRYGTFA